MQPKLMELASMLQQQLPVLMSFVVLRLFGVFTGRVVLSAVTPKRIRPYAKRVCSWAIRARSVAMTVGCGYLALQTFYSPPDSVCAEYEAVKTQGVCALLSLAVLMTSNGVLSSAMALAALMAVANSSASSLVLSSSAVVIANGDDGGALFVYGLFWVATAHAGLCQSDTAPERTHGSIVAVLAILFNVIFYILFFFYMRCMRVASGAAKILKLVMHRIERVVRAR